MAAEGCVVEGEGGGSEGGGDCGGATAVRANGRHDGRRRPRGGR